MSVPVDVARRAQVLRWRHRRTRSGVRLTPWPIVRDELARQGLGRWPVPQLVQAVLGLPVEEHPVAPLEPGELERLERSWRAGWELERPGQPWPGLEVAKRELARAGR
jgi:hypothetical protein